jgi:probable F420-dependent oxidoreductase
MMEYPTPSGRRIRIGIQTPILVQTPGAHARWEEAAEVGDLMRVVVAADELGYHHLTCSEHFALPDSESARRGRTYWDPVSTLAWVAATTSNIRLATNVVVVGYHHPLEILKQYGTVDRLSAGRLILGVGVGTLREEFDLLEAPFDDRGARADDALAAIVAGWGQPRVEYRGEFYRYGPLIIEPHAPRSDLPIWVGGRSTRSLRRAIELGHGWTPFALSSSRISEMLGEFDLPSGFDVILPPSRPLDPAADPQATREQLDELGAAGSTVLHAAFVHHSLEHYLEQLEALTRLVRSAS